LLLLIPLQAGGTFAAAGIAFPNTLGLLHGASLFLEEAASTIRQYGAPTAAAHLVIVELTRFFGHKDKPVFDGKDVSNGYQAIAEAEAGEPAEVHPRV
jgi:hypothetical protein